MNKITTRPISYVDELDLTLKIVWGQMGSI